MSRRCSVKKLGLAMVGLNSYAGEQVAPALLQTQYAYLAGLVSGNKTKALKWACQYNVPEKNVYTYENFDEISNNREIDIVYIILPVALHREYMVRAAEAGKHIICEKPMAPTVKDCQQMITACKKANRLLSIGYRMHFEPHHQSIMNISKKGFGKLKAFESGNGFIYSESAAKAWRLNKALSGGGSLMDMGIYTIQAARYTTGLEPIAVTATQEKLKPKLFAEVDETIFFELEFENGFKANCKSSYNADWSYIQIETEEGLLNIEPAFHYSGIKGFTPTGMMDFPQVVQQSLKIDDFARCVLENKKSRVSGEEGLKDLKVIKAIYKSLATGKRELIN